MLLTTGSGTAATIGVIIYMVPLTYLFFRFGLGGVLDYLKRKNIQPQIIPEIQNLSKEMDSLAEKLDSITGAIQKPASR
ncbi:hypothetical protein [Pedobacter sp. MC2016-24]|uniref:hypothetical protein n=1 Tax=Pedobacter sp. MC2016-24 TaxID=2780090 RepID=UPI00187FCC45|nr:hypothetical protein [Pedobacter sp. MC2016-24]MBE9599852.1 hypothetical protein [Pedobacter sp. MC2016-24]